MTAVQVPPLTHEVSSQIPLLHSPGTEQRYTETHQEPVPDPGGAGRAESLRLGIHALRSPLPLTCTWVGTTANPPAEYVQPALPGH